MRILDQVRDVVLEDVLILLTHREALELKDDLNRILESNKEDFHVHLNDEEYKREITIALYEKGEDQKGFKERINQLIREEI